MRRRAVPTRRPGAGRDARRGLAGILVVVGALAAVSAAGADAARARKALEARLVPVTPLELVQRASRNDVETVSLLVETGVRLDGAEASGMRAGWTALHHAARHEDGKVLAVLLGSGAPVNVQAKAGDTALCVAVAEGYAANVADLLRAKADPGLVCREGRTALHEATGRPGEPSPSIVTALLKAGARLDPLDAAGRTPLMLAASRAQGRRNVEILLAGGANPEIVAKSGQTALHEAVMHGHESVVEALLRGGARPSPRNAEGDTPLHLAARQDAVGILGVLLKYGADGGVRNRLGETPLDTAHKSYRARAEDLLRAAPALGPPGRGGRPPQQP